MTTGRTPPSRSRMPGQSSRPARTSWSGSALVTRLPGNAEFKRRLEGSFAVQAGSQMLSFHLWRQDDPDHVRRSKTDLDASPRDRVPIALEVTQRPVSGAASRTNLPGDKRPRLCHQPHAPTLLQQLRAGNSSARRPNRGMSSGSRAPLNWLVPFAAGP